MTRRIAVSILLTVWAILIAVGVSTYLTARTILLADLDAAIMARAASLAQVTDATGRRFVNSRPIRVSDRFLVRNDIGQTLGRTEPGERDTGPKLLDAAFVRMPDGAHYRRVTLRAFGHPEDAIDKVVPVTVTFSGSAEEFDRFTNHLTWTLVGCTAAGGALAACIAWFVARASLRPLRATAQTIGAIDERALNRRVDTANLPAELKPVGLRLNDMLERLEQAMTRRKRFLADAAHELRTPVAAILTAVEVAVRRPRDSNDYRAVLNTCLLDARLLRDLVESLMTQARAEVPTLDEPPEPIDLATVVEQVLASLMPLANEKSIQVEQDVPAGVTLLASPNRLRSILMNLVGNAIEHNGAGGAVRVAAAVNRNPDDARVVRMSISDTGPGIAAHHLPHLFEPFYRVDKSRGGADGHLGLGLFLVKTHVQAMSGQCAVRSTEGSGTTFELTFPLAADERRATNLLQDVRVPATTTA
jgi:signal transduction histidine kinase